MRITSFIIKQTESRPMSVQQILLLRQFKKRAWAQVFFRYLVIIIPIVGLVLLIVQPNIDRYFSEQEKAWFTLSVIASMFACLYCYWHMVAYGYYPKDINLTSAQMQEIQNCTQQPVNWQKVPKKLSFAVIYKKHLLFIAALLAGVSIILASFFLWADIYAENQVPLARKIIAIFMVIFLIAAAAYQGYEILAKHKRLKASTVTDNTFLFLVAYDWQYGYELAMFFNHPDMHYLQRDKASKLYDKFRGSAYHVRELCWWITIQGDDDKIDERLLPIDLSNIGNRPVGKSKK